MDYIPGHIHEKLQKEYFFLVSKYFIWSNCSESLRYNDMKISTDWDKCTDIELDEGDTIVVRFFKPNPMSDPYSYLERVIKNDVSEVEFKIESIISMELITRNKFLFIDVTKQFERDESISKLLSSKNNIDV